MVSEKLCLTVQKTLQGFISHCFRKVGITNYYKIRQPLVLQTKLNLQPLTLLRNWKYAYILLLTNDTPDQLMNAKLIWRLKRDYVKDLSQQRL